VDEHPQAGKRGVAEDADAHCTRAANAVAKVPQQAAADRGAEHERGREAREPEPADCLRVSVAQQAFRDGQRRDGHEAELEAVEHQPEERRGEDRVAGAGGEFWGRSERRHPASSRE
jgi:hypothetical protein